MIFLFAGVSTSYRWQYYPIASEFLFPSMDSQENIFIVSTRILVALDSSNILTKQKRS